VDVTYPGETTLNMRFVPYSAFLREVRFASHNEKSSLPLQVFFAQTKECNKPAKYCEK
jgi:hypothetical protein